MHLRGTVLLRWSSWVLLSVFALLSGCRAGPERPIRVGLLVWPPYEIFYLAQHLDYLDDSKIELVDFSSNAEVAQAFQSGAVDAVCLTADIFVSKLHADPEARIVLAVDISNGGDALLSRPGLNSIDNMYGAVVGISPSSLGAYLLARALDHTHLKFDDVMIQYLDEVEQVDAYEFGEVDALVAYEPVRSRLIEAGAQTLFDSSQIPGEIVDVLVVNKDVIDHREQDLQELVDAFFRARDELIERPRASAELVAPRENLTPEAYLEAMDRVVLPGPEANRDMLAGPEPPLGQRLNSIAEVLHRIGILREIPELDEPIDARFVRNAKP